MAGIKRTAADHWFSLYVRCRDKWTCQRCHTKYPDFKNRLGEERYNELKRLSNKPFKGFFKNNKEHSAKYRKLFREINK